MYHGTRRMGLSRHRHQRSSSFTSGTSGNHWRSPSSLFPGGADQVKRRKQKVGSSQGKKRFGFCSTGDFGARLLGGSTPDTSGLLLGSPSHTHALSHMYCIRPTDTHTHISTMRRTMLLAMITPSMVVAHMSLVVPFSRNAIDRSLPYWSGGKWWPYQPTCANPDPTW